MSTLAKPPQESAVGTLDGEREVVPLTPLVRSMLASITNAGGVDRAETAHAWTAARLRGRLDVDELLRSLERLVAAHEGLRTMLVGGAGNSECAVLPSSAFRLRTVDLTRLDGEQRKEAAVRMVRDHARRRFAWESEPPFRAVVFTLGEDDRVLLLAAHRFAADEPQLRLLAAQLTALYGADLSLTAATDGAGEQADDDLRYWRDHLAGAPPLVALPTDHVRPAAPTFTAGEVEVALPPGLHAALEAVGADAGGSWRDAAVAAFAALVARHSGEHDLVVATPAPHREDEALQPFAGLATRLLPLRLHPAGGDAFERLVGQAHEALAGARAHAAVPFHLLVDELGIERTSSYQPLCQLAISFEPPAAHLLAFDGVEVSELALDEFMPFDLELAVWLADGELRARLRYAADLFERDTAERLALRFRTLLEDAVARPATRLSRLRLLPEPEQAALREWNATSAPRPAESCVHELFEAQAAATPDALAVVDAAGELTYAELDVRANRLANYLRSRGVGPESIVAVSLGRTSNVVVAFLAALKAGGAYLPLDPSYPRERLQHVVEDADIAALVTDSHLEGRLPSLEVDTILVDDEWERVAGCADDKPDVRVSPQNLAYTIYTSGSTGRPKGVDVPHAGATNLAGALRSMFRLVPGDRVAFFSSLSFDASIWEMLMAFGAGAALCMIETTDASAAEIAAQLRAFRVTVATFPPSFLRAAEGEQLPDLRLLVSAGEQLATELVRSWGVGRRFVNAYGPTETTVCATYGTCDPSIAIVPPIGRPIPNLRAHVLDAELAPVPVGVADELYVGGAGIVRGYRNQPARTAEAFVPDPFGEPGSRLYRTQDLVRLLSSGDVQYLGRADDQVKIRGFRIELGEISETLLRHPDVHDAAVVLRGEDGREPQLVAYVVLEDDARLIAERGPARADVGVQRDLQAFLERSLPRYMLPAAYIVLDELPLSPTGKLDRDALPLDQAPAVEETDEADETAEAETPTETLVARVWAEALGLGRVARDDNFLELGGHSLVAAQVIADVREAFEIGLPVRVLFENPILADFAAAVDAAR